MLDIIVHYQGEELGEEYIVKMVDPKRYNFQSMMSDCCAVALNGKNIDISNCEILLSAFVSGMTQTMPLQNDDDVNRMFLLHGDGSQFM